MGFKDFFIVSDETETKPEQPTVQVKMPTKTTFPQTETKFPSTETKFPTAVNTFPTSVKTVNTPLSDVGPVNPFLDKILDVYDKGFTKLNQPGYDFFEFFKAVSKGGVDNPQAYEMALEMGQAMDSNVSKQLLVSQADFYLTEINKVHTGFSSDGQAKSNDLTNRKNSETNTLVSDINTLKQQLEIIQQQITQKQNSLSEIDQKYQPEIDEVNYKLSANDMAMNQFSSNINRVKTNITNFIK